MELTKVKLGDYLEEFGDGIHGTPNYDENGEYYFINGNNLDNGAILIDSETKRISSDEYDSIKRNLNNRTLLLSINGTLGRLAYYNGENIALGKSACFLNFKENTDRRYFRYILEMKDFRQYMSKVASGSTIKNFSPRQAADYEFFAPKPDDQKKIASVLSALDDKIALNKKMNQKLEAMAKRLYDYWFVQYDFPDKNGRPYKTTGGPMTYNPTLKREIPAGWEVKQICDITKIFNGSTPSTTEEGNYGGEIVWITPKDLSDQNCKFVYQGARNITQAGYDSCSTTMVPKGTVVMSSRAPIGLLSIAQCDLCTNQGFKNMVPNDMTDSKYLYYTIQQHIPQIQNLGTGTTFKEVSKDELGRFAILYPPKKLIAAFEEKVASIFDVQFNKVKEITRLTALRDKLLPLLMNGQVTIK